MYRLLPSVKQIDYIQRSKHDTMQGCLVQQSIQVHSHHVMSILLCWAWLENGMYLIPQQMFLAHMQLKQ